MSGTERGSPPRHRTSPATRDPRMLLAIAALVVLAVPAGLFVWRTIHLPNDDGRVGGGNITTTRATPTPTVPVARLDSIVLSPAEVSTILNDPILQADSLKRVMGNPAYTVSNPDCLSALRAVVAPAYQDSGWTAVRSQYFGDPGTSVEHEARQGVVAFPSADQADAFLRGSAAKWNACVGQTVTAEAADGTTQQVTFDNVSGESPKIALMSTVDAPAGRTCQRTLSAVFNVVVDIGVCGRSVTDEASRIAFQIAANIDRIT